MSSSGGLLTRPLVVLAGNRTDFRHDVGVKITTLTSTDAFHVIDIEQAATSTGIVRWAKKVLVDGASNLARSITYSYAVFGIEESGASAGINAAPEGREEAIARFVEEITPLAAAQTLLLDAGKGVNAEDLASLVALDQRSSARLTSHDRLLAASVTGAAGAAITLEGATVCVEDIGAASEAIATSFSGLGATVTVAPTAEVLASDADILCIGSKVGLIDHEVAATLHAKLLVPIGPLPVTARGLAVARRNGVAVLPDFVTTAGPLLAGQTGQGDPDAIVATVVERVGSVISALNDHPDGHLLGACHLAETFLRTWVAEMPFGRPLA